MQEVGPAVEPSARGLPLAERVLALAERHRYKLFAVLLVWYLLGFNGQWRLEPDSALYLTIGRNLAEGWGYTYHGEPHRLAFPGPPLLFAATFKLFHTQSLLPAVGLMLAIGLATLALTYRLFLLYAGRPTAVLMAFGLGISRLFYRYCFELLSDMPFLLGVMAFLAGYEAVFYRREASGNEECRPGPRARWFDWLLLIGGLLVAVVMRPTMWALLAAIALATWWRPRARAVAGADAFTDRPGRSNGAHRIGATTARPGRDCEPGRRWPQLVILCVIVAAAVGFSVFDPRHAGGHTMGQYEDALFEAKISHIGTMLRQTFGEYIPLLFESSVCKAVLGCPIGLGLNSVAGAVFLVLGIGLVRVRPLWGLWVAMTVATVLVAVKPLDRYFLEVLPLLVYAWWRGIRWLNLRIPQPWGNRLFLVLFLLGGTTNVLRTSEFIFEQRWVPFREYYPHKEGRYASADRVGRLVREHVPENAWVVAPSKYGRILTFLSRRRVIEPNGRIHLEPAREPVYVLEPLDEQLERWLTGARAHLGPPIGPAVQSRHDPAPWRLHRALAGQE